MSTTAGDLHVHLYANRHVGLTADTVVVTKPGGTFSESSIARYRPCRVSFDDLTLVANAGLILVGTLVLRLGSNG